MKLTSLAHCFSRSISIKETSVNEEEIQCFSLLISALCGIKCYMQCLNRMTRHTVLTQMNSSHKFFTWGFECTGWNLWGFLQGRYKLKKNQYFYFSYSLNFLLNLGRKIAVQVVLNEETWRSGHHSPGHHFGYAIWTKHKFLDLELLRIIFLLTFPVCLLVYLREKNNSSVIYCLAYLLGYKGC